MGGSFTMINSDTINQLAKWVGGSFTDSCEVFVGIENNVDSESKISIYPNPTNGNFTIEIDNTKNASIEIFNISGQLFLQNLLVENTTQFDLSNYSNGMYFVKIETQEETVVKKIVLQ
jgi:hypothetical protein